MCIEGSKGYQKLGSIVNVNNLIDKENKPKSLILIFFYIIQLCSSEIDRYVYIKPNMN